MAQKKILSEQGKLQLRDFVRGAVLAVIAAVLTPLVQSAGNGEWTIDWPIIGNTALIAFLGYIGKNLGEPTKEIIIKDDKK